MCINKISPIRNGLIKACFIIATLCIAWLTYLASEILITYHQSQSNVSFTIEQAAGYHHADSVDIRPKHEINYSSDSSGISVLNVDDHKILNTELNLSEPSGLLDSIVYNLTLAVNTVNNILTSGSILIAILTLFIALVGIFAYHDLKNDIQEKLDKGKTDVQKILGNEKTEREKFVTTVNETLCEEITNRKNFETPINNRIITIEQKIDECCKEAKYKMKILEKTQIKQDIYFKKSIEYLYTISTNQLENDEDNTLRDSLYHDLQIMMLYRYEIYQDNQESDIILHQKKSALDYLMEEDNGKEEDIPDLEYVAQNDPNEEIRRRAIEVIGVIKKNYNLQ